MIQVPFFTLFPLFSRSKWIKIGYNLIGILAFSFLCMKSSFFGWSNREFLYLCPIFSSASIKADTMLIRKDIENVMYMDHRRQENNLEQSLVICIQIAWGTVEINANTFVLLLMFSVKKDGKLRLRDYLH